MKTAICDDGFGDRAVLEQLQDANRVQQKASLLRQRLLQSASSSAPKQPRAKEVG
jgi:hypothetical protein